MYIHLKLWKKNQAVGNYVSFLQSLYNFDNFSDRPTQIYMVYYFYLSNWWASIISTTITAKLCRFAKRVKHSFVSVMIKQRANAFIK